MDPIAQLLQQMLGGGGLESLLGGGSGLTTPMFSDPKKDLGKKPLFMSKKKWNSIQEDIESGDEITNKKPFLMSDKRWQELRENAQKAQVQTHMNAPKMDLFNSLFGELSQFEGLEGFGDLNADTNLTGMSMFGAAMPLLERINQERNKPKDTDLANFTSDPSIIPSYQTGGEVEQDTIQTEEGEIVVTPDLTIADVKSKSTHKKLKKGEITDIVPEGSFIFSDKVKVRKKDADRVFAYKQPEYKEQSNEGEVEEFNFKDLFGDDDKLGTAELARRIREKFEVIDDEEGNKLTETANMENKISRAPYIESLIELHQMAENKNNVGKPTLEIPTYGKGGRVTKKRVIAPKGKNVEEYPIGGIISGIAGLGGLITNIIQGSQQKKQYNKNLQELEELLGSQKETLSQSSLMNLMGVLGQDPSETAPDLTATINTYKQQLDKTPQYLKDYSTGQLQKQFDSAATQVFENAPNFSTGAANLQKLYSNTLQQTSDVVARQNTADISLRNQYLAGLSQLYARDADNQAAKEGQERTNRNQQFSAATGTVSNYLNQLSALDTAALNTKFQLQGANTTAQNSIINSATQNAMTAAAGFSNVIGKNKTPNKKVTIQSADQIRAAVPLPGSTYSTNLPWGRSNLLPLAPADPLGTPFLRNIMGFGDPE